MVQYVVAVWPELGQKTLVAGQWSSEWNQDDNKESAIHRAVLIHDYEQFHRYHKTLCVTRQHETFGEVLKRLVYRFQHMGGMMYSDAMIHVVDYRGGVIKSMLNNGISAVTIIRPVWGSKKRYIELLDNADLSDLPSDIGDYRYDHYKSLKYGFDVFYREATSIQRAYGKSHVQIINVNLADPDRPSLDKLITQKVLSNAQYQSYAYAI